MGLCSPYSALIWKPDTGLWERPIPPASTGPFALIANTDDVAVTEPVIMEVIAGARSDEREQDLRRLMQRFPLLPFDPGIDFDAATRVYRM